ncbi:MAG: hypothetical protein M0Q95_11005 [Porticoccaceae bacterium]|nr:hypothetical protein [Porticoccaceae bacterium]
MAFIQAFGRLSFSRPAGMVIGAIPLSEITYYWYRVEQLDDLDTWIDIMQAMDGIFLEFHSPKK